MGTGSKTPTEAMTSINAKNLYQMSLMCFSFSLILFVATYSMVSTSCLATPSGGEGTCSSSSSSSSYEPISVIERNDGGDGDGDDMHTELVIGYNILHDTLKKESQLRFLHWLQGATFRGPKGSLKTILTTIYKTSKTRKSELESLFLDQAPAIDLGGAPESAMGDSIQKDVEKSSAGELVTFPSLTSGDDRASKDVVVWGIRLFLIQAQATRMVVALSTSLTKFEKNEVRKQWLSELANEFEAIRESIVDSILENLGEEPFDDWLGIGS